MCNNSQILNTDGDYTMIPISITLLPEDPIETPVHKNNLDTIVDKDNGIEEIKETEKEEETQFMIHPKGKFTTSWASMKLC